MNAKLSGQFTKQKKNTFAYIWKTLEIRVSYTRGQNRVVNMELVHNYDILQRRLASV